MHLGNERLSESRGSGYIALRVVFHVSCFEKWGAAWRRVQLGVASTSGGLSAIFATIYTSGGSWFWLLLLLL